MVTSVLFCHEVNGGYRKVEWNEVYLICHVLSKLVSHGIFVSIIPFLFFL